MSLDSLEVTRLLHAVEAGRPDAWDRLLPVVYDELKKLAGGQLRRERSGHTMQPTALVHECYLRLAGADGPHWENRTHFFGAAANVMRRVLVDHARARLAQKRGGGAADRTRRDDLDDALVSFEERSTDLLALDEALTRLAAIDAEQSRIVELRFFGGLSTDETAAFMNVSPSSVDRGWRIARAWLLREIEGSAA